MSEFAGRISRPRPERAGVCNATRLATRLPNGLPPAAENEYALSLNGVDQYVDCGGPMITGTGDFTYSVWVKPSAVDGDIGGNYGTGNTSGVQCFYQANGKFTIYIAAFVESSAYTVVDKWYHVAYTRASGSVTIYVNGVADGTGTLSGSITGDHDWFIGAQTTTNYFNGSVDEASIWSAALSAEAVAAVYNSGRPIDLNYGRGDYANSADLMSWWRMGDINLGGGETVPDAAGSNDGTLENEPAYTVDNPPNYSNWALGFDGVDQYGASAGDDTLASKSFSFWAKSTETSGNDVFDHGGDTQGAFRFNWSSNRPILLVSNGEGGGYVYTSWADNSGQDDGAWHHHVVYIEHDDITNCKWYVDGVAQTPDLTVNDGTADAYTTGIRIGRGGSSYFEGSLDEFAIFDGELTNAEVNEIFRAGLPGTLDGMSPEHWFRMGENNSGTGDWVTDMGSESDDLALYNSPTFERSVPAADASWNYRSIGFDGVDQSMTAPVTLPSDIYTVSCWIKWEAAGTVYWFDARDGSNVDAIAVYTHPSGDDMLINIYHSDTNVTTTGYDMTVGEWYHLVLVKDGATFNLYKNGTLWVTDGGNDDSSNGATIRLAARYTSANFSNADFDELAIFTTALSAGAVNAIYNGGIPFDLSGYSPAAWYRMGDGDNPGGTTITDRSGQNNGTTENSPTWASETP